MWFRRLRARLGLTVPRRDGIDVAKYQGTINWAQVKAAGVYWTAIKATLGSTVTDPYFRQNRAGVHAQGFRHKLLYAWPVPGAVKPQVDHLFAVIGRLEADEGIMCDAEQAGITVAGIAEWCDRVEQVTQKPVAVYTGLYVAGLWTSPAVYHGGRARVLAYYGSEARMLGGVRNDGASLFPDAWQWIGTGGRCPGVVGDVDCDQIYNAAVFDRACGLNLPPPPPPPVLVIPNLCLWEEEMRLVRGDGPIATSGPATSFPFAGNGGAVWGCVYTDKGAALVHIEDGNWAACQNPVAVQPQSVVDRTPKMTGAQYRAALAALAVPTPV